MSRRRRTIAVTVFLSVVLTAVGILGYVNLTPDDSRVQALIEPLYAVDSPQFRRSLGSLVGPQLTAGNRVVALQNGDEIFPAMLDAIRHAEKTIDFEIYIYWKGDIGRAFTDALCERAEKGVKVNVLMDWVGSQEIDEGFLRKMADAGVAVEQYRPLRWYTLDRMNHRTHRRILVVDGRIGFTGGVGVADKWTGHAQDEDHWRDVQYRIEGPAAAEMQAAFMVNWLKMRPALLHGDEFFPETQPAGGSLAQMITSDAGAGSENLRIMYLLSVASAQRQVLIANAYFVPDALAVQELVAARRRGVSVQVIVPGDKTDVPLTRHASRALWGPLLEAGVEIYEYQPTMYHCKVMIVDDVFVSVGSTNFDNRSFRLNDEANLNIIDAPFAAAQAQVFEADRRNSRKIELAAWRERPWYEKAKDWAASKVKDQL